jgi:transcriptional regulator GlxA family with amidase domain
VGAARTSLEILALPNTTASGLYGLCDVLSSVGVVWETFVSGRPAAALFDVRVVAASRQTFHCATGGVVAPDAALEDSAAADLVVVPGISAPLGSRFGSETRRVLDWLRRRKEQGSRISSACTGALVLAEAGLLDGREATTHWAYRDVFRRHYPRVKLRIDKNLCIAADGTVTAGGTTAWQQLALFVIRQYCGRDRAIQASKFWLLSDMGESQGPYAAMPLGGRHDDQTIRDCQAWMVDHYGVQRPVETMIARSCLPPTTFARRFRRATGYAPMEYVHAVRVEAAKRLLETSDRPVEHVGGLVGYEDTASFRRLFKRETGLAPRDYRRLFRGERFAVLTDRLRDVGGATAGLPPTQSPASMRSSSTDIS